MRAIVEALRSRKAHGSGTADHDRGARRRGQVDARGGAGRGAARARRARGAAARARRRGDLGAHPGAGGGPGARDLTARGGAAVRGGARAAGERAGDSFFEAIASAYEQLAREEPQRIRTLDASQPRERVLADALEAIADILSADASATARTSAASD